MRLTVWEPLTEQGSGHAAVGHTFKRVMSATRPRLQGPGALLGPSQNIRWELWGLAERGEGGHGFGASPPPVCAHFSKLHPRRHWHWSVFDSHTDGNNVVASHGQNVAPALQVPLTTSSGPRQGVCGLSLYRHTQQLSRSTETPPPPPKDHAARPDVVPLALRHEGHVDHHVVLQRALQHRGTGGEDV